MINLEKNNFRNKNGLIEAKSIIYNSTSNNLEDILNYIKTIKTKKKKNNKKNRKIEEIGEQ